MTFFSILAVIATGILSAMGMGGGGVFILYLDLFTETPQQTAQGMNLLLFIPSAMVASFYYVRKKVFKWREVPRFALWGLLGAVGGCAAAVFTDASLLRKGFGLFLLWIGLRELYTSLGKKQKKHRQK